MIEKLGNQINVYTTGFANINNKPTIPAPYRPKDNIMCGASAFGGGWGSLNGLVLIGADGVITPYGVADGGMVQNSSAQYISFSVMYFI